MNGWRQVHGPGWTAHKGVPHHAPDVRPPARVHPLRLRLHGLRCAACIIPHPLHIDPHRHAWAGSSNRRSHTLVTVGVHCRESRGSMWRNHMPPPPPRKNNQDIYNNTPRFPSAGRSQKGGRGRVDSASCNQEGLTDDDGADGPSDIEDNIEYAQGRGRSRSGMYWVFAV